MFEGCEVCYKSMYERDYIHRRALNLKSDVHVLMAGYRKLRNKVCHDIDIGKRSILNLKYQIMQGTVKSCGSPPAMY